MAGESTSFLLGRFVTELEHAGKHLLEAELGISYKRAVFLFVLQFTGTITQHKLAETLGYSDPAVSTMLRELAKAGYAITEPDPEHGRKQLVTLTDEGHRVAVQARKLLDRHFDELIKLAEVDEEQLQVMTKRLLAALRTKTGKEI